MELFSDQSPVLGLVFAVGIAACGGGTPGSAEQAPRSAAVARVAPAAEDVSPPLRPDELRLHAGWLAALTEEEKAAIERYLRGQPRWEVRIDPDPMTGRVPTYAVRKERTAGVDGDAPPYPSARNGFYVRESDGESRVIVSLSGEIGFGRPGTFPITRAAPDTGVVQLETQTDGEGSPGLSSYLVVTGGRGVTVEVFEQSSSRSRQFTREVVTAVLSELEAALAHRAEILRRGLAQEVDPDASMRTGPPRIRVGDGMQPGLYHVDAWLNPGGAGMCSLRVRYSGPDPEAGLGAVPTELRGHEGMLLSEDRVTLRSARLVGYGPDPHVLFPYTAEIAVYEGDWQSRYRARFELWCLNETGGPPRKMVETERTIAGWQQ